MGGLAAVPPSVAGSWFAVIDLSRYPPTDPTRLQMAEGMDKITWDGEAVCSEPPFGTSVVVYRRSSECLEFLMLHRAQAGPLYEGDWAWTPPSGGRLPGESIEACAVRELKEESGIELSVRETTYGTPDWIVFMAEAPADALVRVGEDLEHDRFEWLGLGEVRTRCRPHEVLDPIVKVAEALVPESCRIQVADC